MATHTGIKRGVGGGEGKERRGADLNANFTAKRAACYLINDAEDKKSRLQCPRAPSNTAV